MKTGDFFETVIDYIDNEIYRALLKHKLNLGGVSGPLGGSGAPPAGVVGKLPQTRVTFDTTEEASPTITSGYSLLDNLNRMRYWGKPARWFEPAPLEQRQMKIHINSGIWYHEENIYVDFEGADSPTITSPDIHNRIDVVYVTTSGDVLVEQGTEAVIPQITMPSGNTLPIAALYITPNVAGIGWSGEFSTYSGYICKDLRKFIDTGRMGTASGVGSLNYSYITAISEGWLPNARKLLGGDWLKLTDGGEGNDITMAFLPDKPAVYNPTTGAVTEYGSISLASASANSGEIVVVPPGTYDETLVLRDNIPVVELFSDTVTIACTLAGWQLAAVYTPSTAGNYYINVKKISMIGSDPYDPKDACAVRIIETTTGTVTIKADLYCKQLGSTKYSIGLGNYGTATVYYTGDIEVTTDGVGSYGVRNNTTGTVIGKGDVKVDGGDDGFSYMLRNNSTGTIKWQGDGDIDTVGSDTYGDYAIGIQNRGGTIEWRGFLDVHASAAEAIGIQSYVGGGTIYAEGRVIVFGHNGGINGIVVGHTPTESTCKITFRGYIDASTSAGAVYGSMMSPTQGNGTITLHADIVVDSDTGAAYGVRNDGPGKTIFWNGSVTATGDTASYDLYQVSGTLEIFSIDYITIYGEVIVNYQGKVDKYGQHTTASGRFTADGDAQGTYQLTARREVEEHVVNTWYSLYLDGTALQATIAASTAWTVYVSIIGITQYAAQQWSYEIIGLIERDNANNTTLAGQTQRVIFESDANYEAQLVADDTNEALEVQVRRTGGDDYIIRWAATIRTVEVSYP